FGRFQTFRGWSGHTDGEGLLIDIESGRSVLENLTTPHDPRRIEGGWLLNEAGRARTVFFPDEGEPQLIAQFRDFTRGLLVFPGFYVIGTSGHRHQEGGDEAAVHVVDCRTGVVQKSIPLPYREIAHLFTAPEDEL